jgi:hypothetical protein
MATRIGLATALVFVFVFVFVFNNTIVFIALCVDIFTCAKVMSSPAYASFDRHFRGVFDDHLDRGKTVVIINVARGKRSKLRRYWINILLLVLLPTALT